ncbi:MAG: sugar isomerase, partial [Planctomycetes bacterium]|nr:sugar isomerase [Planctomycetota bacterium]
LADFVLNLPGQIVGDPNEVPSIQPMASLLEQALLLFTDILVMLLMKRKNVSMEEMKRRHTNLEGRTQEFA